MHVLHRHRPPPALDLDTRRYFEIADREDLVLRREARRLPRLADEYFDADRYHDFCDSRLAHVDELVLEWIGSADFDRLLVGTVRSTYPAHEHERFVEHLRGLVAQWVREQGERLGVLSRSARVGERVIAWLAAILAMSS